MDSALFVGDCVRALTVLFLVRNVAVTGRAEADAPELPGTEQRAEPCVPMRIWKTRSAGGGRSVGADAAPGFNAFRTASDGHAKRSTATSDMAAPLGPVTIPVAIATPDDAEPSDKDAPAGNAIKTTAPLTTQIR